jgi:hypothetical protein
MAEYSAAEDEFAVHRRTTTAGVPDSVRFAGRRRSAEVVNLSADEGAMLFFTVDGSKPVVDGPTSYLVVPGGVLEVADTRQANDTLVRVISDGAALYSVTTAPLR